MSRRNSLCVAGVSVAALLAFTACSSSPPSPPDAAPDLAFDAAPADATDAPADAAPRFPLCSLACPGETLVAYYGPDNAYDYSYCTGSLRQCDDPTAPRCGGCPPP